MTLPATIRVFFAVDLPGEAKEKIGRFIGSLKKNSKTNAIRWTKPENLHITLQFLPELKTEHLAVLIKNVRAEIEGKMKLSTLSLGMVHLFPNPYRPRVIVLDIQPQEDLAMLAGFVGHGIRALNYEVENRPFRAHLTLGRIKQPQGLDLSFLSDTSVPKIEQNEVGEIILFRSEPQPEGSVYSCLERIGLKK